MEVPAAESLRQDVPPDHLTCRQLVGKVTPDSLVRRAIDASFDLAERLSGKEDVIRRAGVRELTDLRRRPLEECDRLAWQAGVSSQFWGTVQGGVTGFGGIFTTLVDVPLLFVFSLRTILKIGHCYGYPLKARKDHHFVLGMLIAALSGTLESRRRRIDEVHELEECLVEEAQEEIVAEELISFLFQLEIFDEIPGMGAISGAALNLTFMPGRHHGQTGFSRALAQGQREGAFDRAARSIRATKPRVGPGPCAERCIRVATPSASEWRCRRVFWRRSLVAAITP